MKRAQVVRHPVADRRPEIDPTSGTNLRDLVHDMASPIAAIRLSASSLKTRKSLNERELADVRRIEDAAGAISRTVATLAPEGDPRRSPLRAAASRLTDVYLVCCELADVRRRIDGRKIHCRAFGDPRGKWDPRQVTKVVATILDHTIRQLGSQALISIAVTGMARHVRVEIHGSGWLSSQSKKSCLSILSSMRSPPAGTLVTAVVSPTGGTVYTLRLPR